MPVFHFTLLQRSYNEHLFKDAVSKMTKANIKSSLEIEKFSNLGKKVNTILVSKTQNDMDFSDAPEKYRGVCRLNTR